MAKNEIIESWIDNAAAWIQAIDGNEIPSRVAVTNNAIVNKLVALKPTTILDAGCGEGWLCRSLQAHQIKTVGFDPIPNLIADAQQKDSEGTYIVCSYETIEALQNDYSKYFNVIVFNFSLFTSNEAVADLLSKCKLLLQASGKIIIQTLHPNNLPAFVEGWQEGSWNGFNNLFTTTHKWYARSIATWETLMQQSGATSILKHYPSYSDTKKEASLILEATY
jgi:2-polyprenyl-3-methyl-5-hydroxy-6-metoxy-1,4-benzoquinol methylase